MKPLLVLLLLGGCGVGADRSTPEGQCQAQADRDPVVRDATMKMLSGSGELQNDMGAIKQQAYRDAYNRCLSSRGFGPAGGVERRRPPV